MPTLNVPTLCTLPQSRLSNHRSSFWTWDSLLRWWIDIDQQPYAQQTNVSTSFKGYELVLLKQADEVEELYSGSNNAMRGCGYPVLLNLRSNH
jgi:hypothetical protein